MKQLTEEWVGKAEGDFKVVQSRMQGANPFYDVVCFLAQQSGEKYLKEWLVEQGQPIPKLHDLEAIDHPCVPSLPVASLPIHDLRYLTSFAVEVRYPGLSARQTDARQCENIASRVRRLVRASLGLS